MEGIQCNLRYPNVGFPIVDTLQFNSQLKINAFDSVTCDIKGAYWVVCPEAESTLSNDTWVLFLINTFNKISILD